MDNKKVVNELESLYFNKLSWIYLNSKNDSLTVISEDHSKITWIPSAGAATIAKKTGLGDGVVTSRTILIDLDSKLFGLYKVALEQPIVEGKAVKLELWINLENRKVSRPKGNVAGSFLNKEQLIALV